MYGCHMSLSRSVTLQHSTIARAYCFSSTRAHPLLWCKRVFSFLSAVLSFNPSLNKSSARTKWAWSIACKPSCSTYQASSWACVEVERGRTDHDTPGHGAPYCTTCFGCLQQTEIWASCTYKAQQLPGQDSSPTCMHMSGACVRNDLQLHAFKPHQSRATVLTSISSLARCMRSLSGDPLARSSCKACCK